MAGDEPSRRRNDRALDEDVPMPRQDPEERVKNFKEVALGYTEEMAVAEARRCLKCKSPQCQKGCPVEVPIPQFIDCIVQGRYEEGIALIKSKNALPAVCGRVCPQEQQCQMNCVRGKRGDPVNIGRLERFLADWEREHGVRVPERPAATGRRVAIIGAGPSGLTAASDLARLGHGVTLFEALHVAGGVLMYGIPEFRLPKEIVQREVEYVQSLGVDLRLGNVIGRIAIERNPGMEQKIIQGRVWVDPDDPLQHSGDTLVGKPHADRFIQPHAFDAEQYNPQKTTRQRDDEHEQGRRIFQFIIFVHRLPAL